MGRTRVPGQRAPGVQSKVGQLIPGEHQVTRSHRQGGRSGHAQTQSFRGLPMPSALFRLAAMGPV